MIFFKEIYKNKSRGNLKSRNS